MSPQPKIRKRQLYEFMEPGRWYTREELGRALGWPRGSLRFVLVTAVRQGAVQMTQDPTGDVPAWLNGRGGHRWAFRRVEGWAPTVKLFRRDGRRNVSWPKW